MATRYQRKLLALVAALPLLGSVPVLAQQAPPAAQTSTEDLLKQIKMLEQRLRALEGQVQRQQTAAVNPPPRPQTAAAAPAQSSAAPPGTTAAAPASPSDGSKQPPVMANQTSAEAKPANKDIFGIAPTPVEGLKLGMYGELKFGTQQNPAANNGDWQNGFDAARLVLLLSYKFTDSIIFNGEIEFEHSGAGFDNDDKLHGTAEVEQAYIDFLVSKYLNIRSPGIDLVPVGFINLHHEPTQFYSVNRPELANGRNNGLVPTTWASPAASVYGKIIDGLDYQFQISSSLEDFGDSFDSRTDGNIVTSGSYVGGISGLTGLNSAKPPRGDYRQLNNELGYTLRLAYEPGFVPGFAGSTSVYFSPNIVPRGAHAEDTSLLGTSSLTLLDTEFRYRPPSTGWEFRGEAAWVGFGNPAALRANNDGDATNNVGSTMWGASGEVAYHLPLGRALGGDWEAVPFYRYSYMNKQTSGFAGTDTNSPTGAGQQQYHTVGVAVFPTPQLVMKLTYQKVIDASLVGARSDSILGGMGFHF